MTAYAIDGERQVKRLGTRARRLTNTSDCIDAVVASRMIWFEKQIMPQKRFRQRRFLRVPDEHDRQPADR